MIVFKYRLSNPICFLSINHNISFRRLSIINESAQKVPLQWVYNRQGQYCQIANLKFLVAWNGIKMRCSNAVYLRKLYRIWGKFSGTALTCPVNIKKTISLHLTFMGFYATKGLKQPCLICMYFIDPYDCI